MQEAFLFALMITGKASYGLENCDNRNMEGSMKNAPKGKRQRAKGTGSPYARHNKAPYRYPFPVGKDYMEHIIRTGEHWVCQRREGNRENGLCLALP